MAFAIYRCEKLKTPGEIIASADHNCRGRPTPNADPLRADQNRQLHGFKTIPSAQEFLAEWERRCRDAKRKKDAVLLQELFLGTSPEFYTACSNPEEKKRRMQQWIEASMVWLRDEFAENLFAVTLHADETTPHLCGYVLPLRNSKNGEVWLSAKKIFNPISLRRQQDQYAAAVVHLGLERGVKGSRARHTRLQEFYARVEQGSREIDAVKALLSDHSVTIPERGILEPTRAYQDRVNTSLREERECLREAASRIEALVSHAGAVALSLRAQRETSRSLSSELESTKMKLSELAGRVRDIPLADVMLRFGHGEPTREGSSLVWRTGAHVISSTGEKWFDHKSAKGGGKAIDLVMHLMDCDFATSVSWLAGQWAPRSAAAAVAAASVQIVQSAPKRDFSAMWDYYAKPDALATTQAENYLVNCRHLEIALVRRLIDEGVLHGSFQFFSGGNRRAWCVFPHLLEDGRIAGATLRAADDDDGSKRSIGTKTDAFFSVGPTSQSARELAFVESPVDALSYHQLHPSSKVISLGGISVSTRLLAIAEKSSLPISVALDADDAGRRGWDAILAAVKQMGDAFVRRLRRVLPERAGWPCKDWNDVIIAQKHEDSPERIATLPSPIVRRSNRIKLL